MEFNVRRESSTNAVVFMGWTPTEGNNSNIIGLRVMGNGIAKWQCTLYRNSNNGGNDGHYGTMHYMGHFSGAQLGGNNSFSFLINYAPRNGSEQNPCTLINPSRASQSDRSQNRTTKINFLEFDNLTVIT